MIKPQTWKRYEPEAYVRMLKTVNPHVKANLYGANEVCLSKDYVVVLINRRDAMFGDITHLMIQNAQGVKDVPWAIAQQIKNDLLGPERVALQVFPAQSELVDKSHTYHLHVLSEQGSVQWHDNNVLPIRYMKEL